MSAIRLLRTSRALRAATPRHAGPSFALPSTRRTFWSSSSSAVDTPLELASSHIPSISDGFLPLVLAVVLAATSTSDDDEAPPSPWTVERTSKGFGAFASRPIARGELLIAERPLCIWPQGLSQEQAQELFNKLSPKEQKVYLALSRTEGDGPVQELDEIRAIRATNGFAITLPGSGSTAAFVFPRVARINHSCTPNCSQAMSFEKLRMEVYTICDVAPTAELCIEYLPLITSTRAERQRALRNSFGFSACLCPLCTAPPAVVEQSDARRREIKSLGESMRIGTSDRKGTLAKMERIRVLLDAEGYQSLPEFEDDSVSNAYAVYASMYQRSRRAGREE